MRQQQLTFYTNSGGQQTITVQDYDSSTVLEFFTNNKVAVSGKIHHRIRGSRERFRLDYRMCVDPAEFRSLFNNIVSDLTAGNDNFSIAEGSTLEGSVVVTPTERFRHKASYLQQIGEFAPTMEFVAVGLNTIAGGWVEVGWVEADWVEVG